jgi:hypothetical protein
MNSSGLYLERRRREPRHPFAELYRGAGVAKITADSQLQALSGGFFSPKLYLSLFKPCVKISTGSQCL